MADVTAGVGATDDTAAAGAAGSAGATGSAGAAGTAGAGPDRRPIGYWLKEVDRLLEARFAAALADFDVTRRHWQVLNALAEPRSDTELVLALSPFASDTGVPLPDVVRSLADRGWVARDGEGRWAVTDQGSAGVLALQQHVQELRARSAEGVSAQDYAVTVATLRRMAANLTAPDTP